MPPYDKPAEELIMKREDGKKLWQLLTKKRDPNPEVIVFSDQGDRRALSAAYAVCDLMRLPRSVITRPGDPDAKNDGPAPNKHVFDLTKACRVMVM